MDQSSSDTPSRLVIASRESRLALWQSEHVRDALRRLYPACRVDILGMTTRGDQILDQSLSKVGGKGLFVKELEAALADGRADLAVHSAKDVPMELPEGFTLAAIGEREDARDALVSNRYAALAELSAGDVVGTSSLRREAQLRARHPGMRVASLRGNVQTRLAKLDRGDYQAIILAAAGLKRLGLAGRIRSYLEAGDSLPAPGQGALAIECRADRADLMRWLAPLHHAESAACVRAERALSRALSGSCQLPLAAYAVVEAGASGPTLWLRALVASPDGTKVIRDELRASLATPPTGDAPERLGAALAERLKRAGADAIIAALA
jgi:hydroxymethylbilane synthase